MDYANTLSILQNRGYYIGTFDDLWQDYNEVSQEEWVWAVNVFRNSTNDIENLYVYRHNYTDQNTKSYLNLPNYTGPLPTQEDIEQEVAYNRRDIRKQFILDAIKGNGNIRTTQQWGRMDLSLGNSDDNYEMSRIFNTMIRNFSTRIYTYLEPIKEKFMLATQYSLYVNDDFADIHYDGINPGRACAIIIYLADPTTYNNGGGRLVIEKNPSGNLVPGVEPNPEEYDFVTPVYGNYAILDFTSHNIGHAIEMVKNNFQRLAIQTFVGP